MAKSLLRKSRLIKISNNLDGHGVFRRYSMMFTNMNARYIDQSQLRWIFPRIMYPETRYDLYIPIPAKGYTNCLTEMDPEG